MSKITLRICKSLIEAFFLWGTLEKQKLPSLALPLEGIGYIYLLNKFQGTLSVIEAKRPGTAQICTTEVFYLPKQGTQAKPLAGNCPRLMWTPKLCLGIIIGRVLISRAKAMLSVVLTISSIKKSHSSSWNDPRHCNLPVWMYLKFHHVLKLYLHLCWSEQSPLFHFKSVHRIWTGTFGAEIMPDYFISAHDNEQLANCLNKTHCDTDYIGIELSFLLLILQIRRKFALSGL